MKKLTFSLAEFTTGGCFARTAPGAGQWETKAAVKLNGVTFPGYGQSFIIDEPTASEPGGHFFTSQAAIQVGKLTAYSGIVNWSLPSGKQGETKTLRDRSRSRPSQTVRAAGAGSADFKLAWAADGKRSAVFGLNIELPGSITAGPNRNAATLPAATPTPRPPRARRAPLRPRQRFPRAPSRARPRSAVDERGPHYDGLKLSASDVYIGRISVPEVCFSYVPAGGQTEPCEPPQLDGKPYITCETDDNTDRWDGNGILELPVADKASIALRRTGRRPPDKLGGFADNIGATWACSSRPASTSSGSGRGCAWIRPR